MLRIDHYLADYDTLTLSVVISVSDPDSRLTDLRVLDRFQVGLHEEALEQPSNGEDVYLREIPRGRFPIFVEVANAADERLTSDPLYYAPTDEEYDAGVPLPPTAVDEHNDPELRRIRTTLIRHQARMVAYGRNRRNLLDQWADLVANQRTVVISVLIMGSATLVISAVRPDTFLVAIPALATLLFGFFGWQLGRRMGAVRQNLEELTQQHSEASAPAERAMERLRDLELPHLIPTGTSCHCAGLRAPAKGE